MKNGNKAPSIVSKFDSSAGGAAVSVKTGPRISKNMAAALNGPNGKGAVPDMSKGSPALVVRRAGRIVSTVEAAELLKLARPVEAAPVRHVSPGAMRATPFAFRTVKG